MKENAKFCKIRDQKTTTENYSDMANGLKSKIQSEAVLNGSQIIIVSSSSSTRRPSVSIVRLFLCRMLNGPMLVKKALDALKYFIIKPYLRNPSGSRFCYFHPFIHLFSRFICFSLLFLLWLLWWWGYLNCILVEQAHVLYCTRDGIFLLLIIIWRNKSGLNI